MADGGYDVADPCDVDPLFGTLADFDALLAAAHERGIRVTVDVVPNHFSDQHPWFQAALAAGPGSPERARFIFRPGRGEHGELPPNNWPSVFGGPAWHRVPDGEWYLHLFAPEQPDVELGEPRGLGRVRADLPVLARPRRGRVPHRRRAQHGQAGRAARPRSAAILPRDETQPHALAAGHPLRPGRGARHPPDVPPHPRLLRRRPDGRRRGLGARRRSGWRATSARTSCNLTFNFELVVAAWGAETFRKAIDISLAAMAEVGAPCTWVLGNHDVDRPATRYGGGAVGVARARAAALVQLSLPGAAYIYNGEELGLENVELPDEVLQDPTWERSGHTVRGRDGERVPLPWSGDAPPFGFTTAASTWLPMPAEWAALTAAAERPTPTPRCRCSAPRSGCAARSRTCSTATFEWAQAPVNVLAYRRGDVLVYLNASAQDVALPRARSWSPPDRCPVASCRRTPRCGCTEPE